MTEGQPKTLTRRERRQARNNIPDKPRGSLDRVREVELKIKNGDHPDGPEVQGNLLIIESETGIEALNGNGLPESDMPTMVVLTPEAPQHKDPQTSTEFTPLGIRSSYHDVRNQGKLETSDVAQRFYPRWAARYLAATAGTEGMARRLEAKRTRSLGPSPTRQEVEVFNESERDRLKQARERAIQQVNEHFYNEVSRTFGLPKIDPTEPEEKQAAAREAIESFIEFHRKIGKETWNYLVQNLSPYAARLDLRNEVAFSPETPAQWITEYASPATHPTSKAQMVNIDLFAANSAEKSLLDKETRPAIHLSRIQRLLDIALYRSGIGVAEEIKIDGWYDNETNEVKYVNGINDVRVEGKAPEGLRKITREAMTRYVPELGMTILTNPREKTDESFLVKATRYGEIAGEKTGDDTIDVSKVQDTHGIKFAAYGGLEERELLMWTVNEIIQNPKSQLVLCDKDLSGRPLDVDGNPLDIDVNYILENYHNPDVTIDENTVSKLRGRWVSSTEDHVTSNGDSSESVDFLRLQVVFEGVDKPIEIMFEDIFGFLNNIYHTGTFDEVKKRYTGAHHAGLKNVQARRVGKRIFSRDLYHLDIVGQSVRAAHKIYKGISALGSGKRKKS